MKKFPIEAKGMFVAIIGIVIMTFGTTQDSLLFEVIRWFGWFLTAIGCLYAMQILSILRNIIKK